MSDDIDPDRKFSNGTDWDNSIDWDDASDGSDGGYDRHGSPINANAMKELVQLRMETSRLRAENERMREALRRIDGMATTICMKDDAGYGIRAESVMPIYETARAALEGVTEKKNG